MDLFTSTRSLRILRIATFPSSLITLACFTNSLRRSSVKGGILILLLIIVIINDMIYYISNNINSFLK